MKHAFFTGRVASLVMSISFAASPAYALPAFWSEFEAEYIKEDSKDPKEKAFAKLAAKSNKETGWCYVCHIKGKTRKYHNTYGIALTKFLKKEDFSIKRRREEPAACKKEILEAFSKAAKLKSEPEVKDSPTFGELIAEGKLPGKVVDTDDATGGEDAAEE